MEISDHITCLLRNLYAGKEATIRTRHGTMDWFKIGKGVPQGCLLSPCLFNLYAEYIMWKGRLWMNHKLEQDWQEKYQQPQIGRWYHSNGRKWRGTKEFLDENERGKWKGWLKTQHSKTMIMASGSMTSWQIDGEKVQTVANCIFLGSKITADGNWSHEIKGKFLPWKERYDKQY